jgi:hypothetical protein
MNVLPFRNYFLLYFMDGELTYGFIGNGPFVVMDWPRVDWMASAYFFLRKKEGVKLLISILVGLLDFLLLSLCL